MSFFFGQNFRIKEPHFNPGDAKSKNQADYRHRYVEWCVVLKKSCGKTNKHFKLVSILVIYTGLQKIFDKFSQDF